MLTMDPSTLRRALDQLEQAADDHARWHEDLLRAIVCAAPFELNDLEEGSHFRCRLGRWYYEQAPADLWGHPAFAAIGTEHECLHRIATQLLRDLTANAPIVREDFDDLVVVSAQLRQKLECLRRRINDALRNRDVLTGAYGRVEMLPELREWLDLARRGVQRCAIAFMDLDRFKAINDTYGHPVGDAVLAAAVRYLSRHLRPYDKVFRYGGDEFLIALPGADLATARAVIERVRAGLAGAALGIGADGTALHATASFGLALLDPDATVETSIERADSALLLAKTAGRNCAISWDASVTTGTRFRRLEIGAAAGEADDAGVDLTVQDRSPFAR